MPFGKPLRRTRASQVLISELTSPRRRMTIDEMLAFGSEIAAMPILDRRSPNETMDDLNAL